LKSSVRRATANDAKNPLKETVMSIAAIALIVLIVLLIGAMPTWAYSRNWGYAPSGGLGVIAFVVLVMLAIGQL
jgi:Protein of unknown function (DUF3309)